MLLMLLPLPVLPLLLLLHRYILNNTLYCFGRGISFATSFIFFLLPCFEQTHMHCTHTPLSHIHPYINIYLYIYIIIYKFKYYMFARSFWIQTIGVYAIMYEMLHKCGWCWLWKSYCCHCWLPHHTALSRPCCVFHHVALGRAIAILHWLWNTKVKFDGNLTGKLEWIAQEVAFDWQVLCCTAQCIG